MERMISLPVGIIVERRDIAHRWRRHGWRAVEVVANGPTVDPWRLLDRGPGFVRWYAGPLSLDLHRRETDAYLVNLSARAPVLYCVMRRVVGTGGGEEEVRPFHVTASPFEAEEYAVGGDEIVDGIAMPPDILDWVRAFVERHHVEVPFVKRQRRTDGGRFGGRHG